MTSRKVVAACSAVAMLMFLAIGTRAAASPITFAGTDSGVGPGGAHPLSDAAAALWGAAAGSFSLITFESAALGSTGPLVLAAGVTMTTANQDVSAAGVSNDNTHASLGFNTTSGGSRFYRMSPIFGGGTATTTFTFASPTSSFGFYFTGAETAFPGAFTLNFNDGSAQSLGITKDTAGTQFFGFVDAGSSISSVTLTETGDFSSGRDVVGVDDVRYTTAVPEPATLLLLGSGSMVALIRRRRQSR
jgi:hypothetical protein